MLYRIWSRAFIGTVMMMGAATGTGHGYAKPLFPQTPMRRHTLTLQLLPAAPAVSGFGLVTAPSGDSRQFTSDPGLLDPTPLPTPAATPTTVPISMPAPAPQRPAPPARKPYQPAHNNKPSSPPPAAPPSAPLSHNCTSRFARGQCTWFAASMRPDIGCNVSGNAAQWNERVRGHSVSSVPSLHSIMVLEPGVQRAGRAGHVAWVVGISGDTVTTWNANWHGGTFVEYYQGIRITQQTFHTGPGVSFIN